ncbi:Helix-turn-helix domain-containing protein [Lachnospiraceae bacterium NK3A20]|nr:Helix-turn-helix domain-containing protein [Lachnospiraceae bacterium NK3A20]
MASIGSIITKYRKNAGLNQIELAKRLTDAGCPTTNKALSAWERDKAEPSVSTLLQLCLILQIPDIYEEYFGSNPKNPLSTLNDSGKEKVLDYIELLHFCPCYVKERKVIPYAPRRRILRLYTTSVSAGTGNFLDDGQYEEIEVGEEIPEIADYGVRISGDSMEPQFIDHQVVWVHSQETLQDGEIGIFYLNGMSYCKRLEHIRNDAFLISLNKKYAPIPVREDDSFRTFGRVVR